MNITSRILGEAMTPRQKRIYKDPVMASKWAIKHRQRFPEAEPYIATRPIWAYLYARDVIKGRWPEGEAAIAKDRHWAYAYARDVIGGRFPEGEATLAKDLYLAYDYASDIIRGRWPEAEATIATDPGAAKLYLKQFPEAKLTFAMNGWIDWLDL
jgi:hypothetical protein